MTAWPDRPRGRRAVVHAVRGMAATAQPLASGAAVAVLRDGGSAIDAAIAANAVLAVVEPVACGLGGDLFALVWDPDEGALVGLDASGRAPSAARPDSVEREGFAIPLGSPHSWTVPGAVDGWGAAHARWGRLPWHRLFEDAVACARDGFPVSGVVAAAWSAGARRHARTPGFAEVFTPRGHAPREGEIHRNPCLARTFERLADGGPDAFYRGGIASELIEYSEEVGGLLQRRDLEATRHRFVEPLSTSYRDALLWELPPAGQGVTALELVNLVEALGVGDLAADDPRRWHLFVEAKKLAFEDRGRFLADPEAADVPTQVLASKAWARRRAAHVDPHRASREIAVDDPRIDQGDTTFLATADDSGLVASWIQSNYTGFGSGHAVPSLGFGLQNRGAQFSLDADHPNVLAPGKRPFHTIIPAFVTRGGRPWLAYGVMGGDMQPQGHAQVLVRLLDDGLDLQAAGDAPRFHHGGGLEPTGVRTGGSGELHLEPETPERVRRELARLGHDIVDRPWVFGGYQAVAVDPESGVLSGATESRKDGCALGW